MRWPGPRAVYEKRDGEGHEGHDDRDDGSQQCSDGQEADVSGHVPNVLGQALHPVSRLSVHAAVQLGQEVGLRDEAEDPRLDGAANLVARRIRELTVGDWHEVLVRHRQMMCQRTAFRALVVTAASDYGRGAVAAISDAQGSPSEASAAAMASLGSSPVPMSGSSSQVGHGRATVRRAP